MRVGLEAVHDHEGRAQQAAVVAEQAGAPDGHDGAIEGRILGRHGAGGFVQRHVEGFTGNGTHRDDPGIVEQLVHPLGHVHEVGLGGPVPGRADLRELVGEARESSHERRHRLPHLAFTEPAVLREELVGELGLLAGDDGEFVGAAAHRALTLGRLGRATTRRGSGRALRGCFAGRGPGLAGQDLGIGRLVSVRAHGTASLDRGRGVRGRSGPPRLATEVGWYVPASMSADALPPGANAPLPGATADVQVSVAQFGGAAWLVEERGCAPRLAGEADPCSTVSPDTGWSARTTIDLDAFPDAVERIRLLAWTPAPNLVLGRTVAQVAVDGGPGFVVEVPAAARQLRAVELLELYRRGADWKIRAVASGWTGHVDAMAEATGLPATAFTVPAPIDEAERAAAGGDRSADTLATPPDPAVPHEGPSPPVGPPALRELLDSVVGPGPRFGDDTFVDFSLHGAFLRLVFERSGDHARVIAVTPAGEGSVTDTVALAALRATAEAPLARVSFSGDGAAFVSAPAVAHHSQVDSALLKALLAEVWVTAHRFGERVRTARWSFPRAVTEQIPRELRLGVAESLQDQAAWGAVHEQLGATGCTPLADQPAALLAPTSAGQLAIGPALLSGTARGWTVIVERTVRANVRPRPGLWQALAAQNSETAFVRLGVQAEGRPGDPPAILVGYSALQLPRTQVQEDLARGLEMVDEAAAAIDPLLHQLAPDSADHRNNLPWTASRRWSGSGTEVTGHLLIREIAGLHDGAAVPAGLMQRVTAQTTSLGRPGLAYLAHLALLRAEANDAASRDWQWLARELVARVPAQAAPGDAPSATASLHVRIGRLDAPRPARNAAPRG